MFYCYRITNLTNDKVYIGKTKNLKTRWNDHKSRAFNDKSKCYNYPLSRALRKYGPANFQFEMLTEFETEIEVNRCEKLNIAQYKSNICKYGDDFGYNLSDGGEPNSGTKFSKETRAKMSASHMGLRPSAESLIKRSKSRTGIPHTEEIKLLIRNNSKTSKLTLEIAELIRNEYKVGNITHALLAVKYNVSAANIGLIINNKIWRYNGTV